MNITISTILRLFSGVLVLAVLFVIVVLAHPVVPLVADGVIPAH